MYFCKLLQAKATECRTASACLRAVHLLVVERVVVEA